MVESVELLEDHTPSPGAAAHQRPPLPLTGLPRR